MRNQAAPGTRPATMTAIASASGNWMRSETAMIRPLLTNERPKVALPIR